MHVYIYISKKKNSCFLIPFEDKKIKMKTQIYSTYLISEILERHKNGDENQLNIQIYIQTPFIMYSIKKIFIYVYLYVYIYIHIYIHPRDHHKWMAHPGPTSCSEGAASPCPFTSCSIPSVRERLYIYIFIYINICV